MGMLCVLYMSCATNRVRCVVTSSLFRGVGQPSESSSSSSGGSSSEEEGEEVEEQEDSLGTAEAEAQWGVGAMAANPAERIPDGKFLRLLFVLGVGSSNASNSDFVLGSTGPLAHGRLH